MVFHTAPPQPASKARMICSPQLVGGAEASQNGFGDWMPAVFAARLGRVSSGMGRLPLGERLHDSDGGTLAVGHGIDYFATAIDAVASGEVFRIRGLSSWAVYHNAASVQLNAAAFR